MSDDPLIDAAVAVRANAYAPYSRFHVGAALRCADGRIFVGCNTENAAYPEGICAEGGAIAAMVAGGGRQIADIVISGGGDRACAPCGGCRQKIREFSAPGLTVRMVGPQGTPLLVRSLAELLPDAFGPEDLA
ncbi:cytidine deaminase [Gluconacetobacter diazotrophicus PA1 5]|uniref:Cytidine deaminase n=1 Tax=Gluconacetobacter diazotrophicus (strain ATCC 49037 / DSM 5601 / CCUG 37298 / CIP 103539 / LMG 7603 / PAl5) TaxID=272568 RepID=A9HRI2_GLUDA|nr:cytidine deaminase [Gluconacetobacter diazotrophicus]ACI53102.1 cytidine deaminase [Gluconacetobacter diazotrophicus PA1 5]TWB05622.1 cytidine deaminase [Gluconacetobacter diazotrophicus]CAP56917.1 putative cytidine deaminase [Gluconacetobacter diazotrophicus PA1 5]